MKLGKREIDALTCPPDRKDRIVFDDELPGFGLRVTRDGSKTFLFQYRRGDRVRRLRLGRYGELTPAQARKLAEAARGQVAAGDDPVAQREAAMAAEEVAARERRRLAEEDALTLDALIGLWASRQLAHRADSYRREAPRALRHALAALLSHPAHAIKAPMLQRAVDGLAAPAAPRSRAGRVPMSRGKETAAAPSLRGEAMGRHIRAYGSALYGWAMKRNLVAANPFAAVHIESREVTRDRVLTDAELGEVWRASGAIGAPWVAFIRVLLLTLQRRDEVAGMAWAELSPDCSVWELPGARTKNGRPHIVHLAEPVRAILRNMPRRAGSPFVFTTTGRAPLSGFGHAKARLDAAIEKERAEAAAKQGIEPAPLHAWRFHDFRRSGVTVLARKGIRWEVADKLLNHVQGAIRGVAAVYQRHEFLAEREAALAVWAAHVLAVAEDAQAGGKVLPYRR